MSTSFPCLELSERALLGLDSMVESIKLASDKAAAYILDYTSIFQQAPMEEGVTDYFSCAFAKELSKYNTIRIHGNYSTHIQYGGSKTVEKTLLRVGELVDGVPVENQCWHMLIPTRRAEGHLGWDFGWVFKTHINDHQSIFSTAVATEHMIFVQAKNVGAYSSCKQKISFDYGKKNPQSQKFGVWASELYEHCQGTVVVAGLYVLYGIPGCPVGWLTWKELRQFQKKYEKSSQKHFQIAQAVVALVCERSGNLTRDMITDAFFAAEQVEEQEAMAPLLERNLRLTSMQEEEKVLLDKGMNDISRDRSYLTRRREEELEEILHEAEWKTSQEEWGEKLQEAEIFQGEGAFQEEKTETAEVKIPEETLGEILGDTLKDILARRNQLREERRAKSLDIRRVDIRTNRLEKWSNKDANGK